MYIWTGTHNLDGKCFNKEYFIWKYIYSHTNTDNSIQGLLLISFYNIAALEFSVKTQVNNQNVINDDKNIKIKYEAY